MGFFGELKQDLSQAVNELMPSEEQVIPEPKQEEGLSLDKMLENIDQIQLEETEKEAASQGEAAAQAISETASQEDGPDLESMLKDMFAEEDAVQEQTAQAEQEQAGQTVQEPVGQAEQEQVGQAAEEQTAQAAQEQTAQAAEEKAAWEETAEAEIVEQEVQEELKVQEEPAEEKSEDEGEEKIMETYSSREASDETSVITAGMTITGDIVSEGSIDVIGNVNGNIDALGKLNITGHVNGNSKAAEIYAESAKINGEVVSEGAVKIGASTVIIGNIKATSAAIAGAVKGDIDVNGPVVLDTSAIVMGNIKSKSVQINNGAVIEGMCSQCYADVSPTAFFDDYKPEIKEVKKKAAK